MKKNKQHMLGTKQLPHAGYAAWVSWGTMAGAIGMGGEAPHLPPTLAHFLLNVAFYYLSSHCKWNKRDGNLTS